MKIDSSDTLAHDPAVDRLLAIARRNGYVSFEDLKQQLPMARMSALQIAQSVARLERAGILIEVDQDPLLEPSDGRVEPEIAPPLRADAVSLGPAPHRHPERAGSTQRQALVAAGSRRIGITARTAGLLSLTVLVSLLLVLGIAVLAL